MSTFDFQPQTLAAEAWQGAMMARSQCNGVSGSALFVQMADVLEPLAAEYGGQPSAIVRPVLARVWRHTFDAELTEPTLSRCARAIESQSPWSLEL